MRSLLDFDTPHQALSLAQSLRDRATGTSHGDAEQMLAAAEMLERLSVCETSRMLRDRDALIQMTARFMAALIAGDYDVTWEALPIIAFDLARACVARVDASATHAEPAPPPAG